MHVPAPSLRIPAPPLCIPSPCLRQILAPGGTILETEQPLLSKGIVQKKSKAENKLLIPSITFEPTMQFRYPLRFRKGYFMTGCPIFPCLGFAAL